MHCIWQQFTFLIPHWGNSRLGREPFEHFQHVTNLFGVLILLFLRASGDGLDNSVESLPFVNIKLDRHATRFGRVSHGPDRGDAPNRAHRRSGPNYHFPCFARNRPDLFAVILGIIQLGHKRCTTNKNCQETLSITDVQNKPKRLTSHKKGRQTV